LLAQTGPRSIELHDAIVRSCDVYFYDVARSWASIGCEVANAMVSESRAESISPRSSGTIPSSAWKQKRYHERCTAETLSVAIGQGYVATTPLQMARLRRSSQWRNRYLPQLSRLSKVSTAPSPRVLPKVEARIAIDPARSQQ